MPRCGTDKLTGAEAVEERHACILESSSSFLLKVCMPLVVD